MAEAMSAFQVEISDADLTDLRERLRRTRWPERETVDDWSQGVPLAYLRELCAYWATEYEWRATERRLNELAQFRTYIGDVGIHVVHVRSPHPDALPLIITNGWPGSIMEYLDVIGPLTDPAAHGGDPADAFHVICPALPGYGFSDKPAQTGWGVERIADAWAEIMSRLGYGRYGATGTDWGTTVTTLLGQRTPESVVGIHLMPPLAPPDPATFGDLTEAEAAALESLRRAEDQESGYSMQHATRPQTLGYGLTDSPAALCAWIAEKYWAWTDWDRRLDQVITRNQLLDNVTLYWLTGTGTSSARLYWESIRQVNEWISGSAAEPVTVPTGCTIFPRELQRPSRRWVEKRFPDIRYWSEPERGGHFPALEQPERYVAELRSFFRLVR